MSNPERREKIRLFCIEREVRKMNEVYFRCENHERCMNRGTMRTPYAKLCREHFEESKRGFFRLPAETQEDIRREWRVQGISSPW